MIHLRAFIDSSFTVNQNCRADSLSTLTTLAENKKRVK